MPPGSVGPVDIHRCGGMQGDAVKWFDELARVRGMRQGWGFPRRRPYSRTGGARVAHACGAGCRQTLSEAMEEKILRHVLLIKPSTNRTPCGCRIHESSHHSSPCLNRGRSSEFRQDGDRVRRAHSCIRAEFVDGLGSERRRGNWSLTTFAYTHQGGARAYPKAMAIPHSSRLSIVVLREQAQTRQHERPLVTRLCPMIDCDSHIRAVTRCGPNGAARVEGCGGGTQQRQPARSASRITRPAFSLCRSGVGRTSER